MRCVVDNVGHFSFDVKTFCFNSCKGVKTQPKSVKSDNVFGCLQNIKEDKPKAVRDEYEYVSDDGELQIDEFPIRRKKTAPKRSLTCKKLV